MSLLKQAQDITFTASAAVIQRIDDEKQHMFTIKNGYEYRAKI